MRFGVVPVNRKASGCGDISVGSGPRRSHAPGRLRPADLGRAFAHGSAIVFSHLVTYRHVVGPADPRSRSIRRRVSAKSDRGTATSASWNTTFEVGRAELEPVDIGVGIPRLVLGNMPLLDVNGAVAQQHAVQLAQVPPLDRHRAVLEEELEKAARQPRLLPLF